MLNLFVFFKCLIKKNITKYGMRVLDTLLKVRSLELRRTIFVDIVHSVDMLILPWTHNSV